MDLSVSLEAPVLKLENCSLESVVPVPKQVLVSQSYVVDAKRWIEFAASLATIIVGAHLSASCTTFSSCCAPMANRTCIHSECRQEPRQLLTRILPWVCHKSHGWILLVLGLVCLPPIMLSSHVYLLCHHVYMYLPCIDAFYDAE